eukprot:263604-Rhodomonas_salina.1
MGVSSVLTAFRMMALTASRSSSGSALTLGPRGVLGFCVEPEDPEFSELELKGRSGGGPQSLETELASKASSSRASSMVIPSTVAKNAPALLS